MMVMVSLKKFAGRRRGDMQNLRVVKITCISLLLSSTFIIVLPHTSEIIAATDQQISAIQSEAGTQVTHPASFLKLLFLTLLFSLVPKTDSVISSVKTSKLFLRPTIYIFKLRGLLNPVKFQSNYIV
jgi:hypothetical protein